MATERHWTLPVAWAIGLVLILLVDAYIAWRMFATSCPAPWFPEFMVLVLVPGIYLVLMYLTLASRHLRGRGS
ncbi:hypothetical protein SAMN05216241_106144 [Limimonas halophila]|uniref:Transmembrane protein n=1 Tax=Limimonas halophila TaxID=1082479 RepID=A0A1G7S6R2_9PROT|nr:hypothetical protein [Limimonas halophila]SDG18715.1 hypothetical protein SAMN05216241_106144 [Limimonas halophila]